MSGEREGTWIVEQGALGEVEKIPRRRPVPPRRIIVLDSHHQRPPRLSKEEGRRGRGLVIHGEMSRQQ